MRISELYGESSPVRGKDTYVVGLGPSMTVFPMAALDGRTCVLLNDAQKFFPALGPIAFANHRAFLDPLSPAITHAIVKGRLKSDPHVERSDNHVPWDHPRYHVFSYRIKPHDSVNHDDESLLLKDPDHYWRGPVAVYACQFLLLAGARSITLVGCDCGALAGEDYCHRDAELNRRLLAKTPERRRGEIQLRHNYEDYASGLLRLRREASAMGVPMVSMTPFFGLFGAESQYQTMRAEDGRPIVRARSMTMEERLARRRAIQAARQARKLLRGRSSRGGGGARQ